MSRLAAFCVLCQNVALDNVDISVCYTVVRLPLENLSEVRATYTCICFDKLALTERKFVVSDRDKSLNESWRASRKLLIFQFRHFPDELVVCFNAECSDFKPKRRMVTASLHHHNKRKLKHA